MAWLVDALESYSSRTQKAEPGHVFGYQPQVQPCDESYSSRTRVVLESYSSRTRVVLGYVLDLEQNVLESYSSRTRVVLESYSSRTRVVLES